METFSIQCPTCFEWFEIPAPPPAERPCDLDYDCEVCCRPMVVQVEAGEAWARGLDDA